MIKFKPMLAPNDEIDLSSIRYPMLASTKLDGIRCIFMDGKMLSRSLKPIPNKQMQEKFKPLASYSKVHNIILDGELYGKGMSFQDITHFVMTQDLNDKKNLKKVGHSEVIPDKLKFHCFEAIDMNKTEPFRTRFDVRTIDIDKLRGFEIVEIVEQKVVHSKEEVEQLFEKAIKSGFEGLILKNPLSPYKLGRTTVNEGLMYKVKQFQTFDAKIISVEERFENTSESYINELGKKQKHNLKEAMKPTGIAGAFIVDYNGQRQKVVITGEEAFRKDVWLNRFSYIGRWIEYKGMLVGSKDKVRHPTFIRFREDKNGSPTR